MKMGDLKCVISFMMFASAVFASSLSELELTITNGPQDTTVCMNDMAECTCGYDGVNPALLTPDWIIVSRSSSGSVISNVTIYGRDIIDNKHDGFRWIFGPRNSTSSPSSKLVLGPVNKTHSQSSYQCVFRFVITSTQFHFVKSRVGTLTVVDPSVRNIMVNEACLTSLSISWNIYSDPVCGNLSQSVTISSIANDTSTFTIPSNDRYFMFTNLSSETLYNVTVTLMYKKRLTTTTIYNVKTSAPCIPPPVIDIATDTENDDIRITWKMPELNCCVSKIKYYSVTVVSNENSTSKTFAEQEAHLSDFLVYHANISFTVIIVAVNSQGSSEPTSETIGDTKEEEESNDGGNGNESNTAVIVIIVIILILFIIVIVAAIIILVYWKYHAKGEDCNKNATKLPMENSFEDSQNTNDNSDLAYAVTGPSSLFKEHRDANNTTETTDSTTDCTNNYEDVPTTPPQLPPKLNYAELQMADQLPGTIQKDTRVTYAKTIPA